MAIIAGGGNLSEAIIKSANDKGWDVTVFAIGRSSLLKSFNIKLIEMNKLDIGMIFRVLKSQNIKNICMVGYIPRPGNLRDYFRFQSLNIEVLG